MILRKKVTSWFFSRSSILFALTIIFINPEPACQETYRSFELRCYSNLTEANGITDFHGETEQFNTEERIDFLKAYGEAAKDFFNVTLATFGVNREGQFYDISGDGIATRQKYLPDKRYSITIEADLVYRCYNVCINDSLIADFVPMLDDSVNSVDCFQFKGNRGIVLDNIQAVSYKPSGVVGAPYEIHTIMDENFEYKPSPKGWIYPEYDDTEWEEATLPRAHGGERFAGEDLYFRKSINPGDFEGYPKYIKQVYNHPSIVMWEVTNHPYPAKPYTIEESNAFYRKVYQTIYPVDPSRLISPTSENLLTRFGNDAGTVDTDGNPVHAVAEYTAPMITRGNQDSYTGYGKTWDLLRKIPSAYHQDFLNSRERAYFNFEHEESISQPNWSLMKGKPWYMIPSYEWDYDKGSIGRKLDYDEWLESQAWQAFSAWESMKKQRLCDYDGFSWCCLHGGPNMGTYRKPLVDCLDHAKLSYYVNRMIFQKVVACV